MQSLSGNPIKPSWMSTHMAVVTVALIVLAKIRTIKQKYFEVIKSIYTYKFNKQGFIKTRFLVRKRKLLDIHRQILKTGLLILCISEVILNLRKLPIHQVQYSNWNISYAYDQLSNSKITSSTMGYWQRTIGLRFPEKPRRSQAKYCGRRLSIWILPSNILIKP